MTEPHFQDDLVTVYAGDCLDILKELPDNSVDSVVTDPPYGLEFMGKDWDAPWANYANITPGNDSPHARKNSVNFVGSPNPTCRSCGGLRSLNTEGSGGRTKCRCASPDFPNYRLKAMAAFQAWCQLWAAECLRVLKPGGHMLAFGGTRTSHRLACAIEDAGFEIRDSIAWLYGSGFPKSLNVALAIDKAAGATEARGEGINVAGVSQSAKFGTAVSAAAGNLKPAYTDAVTADAQKWQGWGTALKPAHEPIVVARKPLGGSVDVRGRVENELRRRGVEGEIRWSAKPVSDAARPSPSMSSLSTDPQSTVEASADPVAASEIKKRGTQTENDSGRRREPGPKQTPTESGTTEKRPTKDSATPSSPRTDQTAPAAGKAKESSLPSTTSTEAAARTERPSTGTSTPNSADSGSPLDTESFAGTATGLTGSQAHVLISRNPDGTFNWPDGLPERVAAGSTVAANVLAHGTGALNVDGCRIEGIDPANAKRLGRVYGDDESTNFGDSAPMGQVTVARVGGNAAGRWPANVVLDPAAAAELDRQSAGLHSAGFAQTGGDTRNGDASMFGIGNATDSQVRFGDTGGASRFFYVAKAGSSERPRDNDTAHPTVKPLDLMRWLVRLVTPPGGVVLDPFLGSGTTAEACIVEGFRCIGIERETDYLPLIVRRLTKPIQPDLFGAG